MAMGRRGGERQAEFWVATQRLPTSPGHVFYEKLNGLLAEAGFDTWVETLCEPHYAKSGRPGIPPGVYFRMLLAGYFEGIGSQRGIAWRCSDSLSLRNFLGLDPTEDSPDHSSLTVIRQRLPIEVHREVFTWILGLARIKNLLNGKTLGIDSTTLEANAAMKSIVRRETGEDWQEFLTNLMREEGILGPDEIPTREELQRFDKKRKGKKVSNEDWESPGDPDSRIAKMKDGTTHLAYKAEHAVDLETEMIVAAEIYPADVSDHHTLEDTAQQAEANLRESGSDTEVRDVVADKGYHSAEELANIEQYTPYRTYVPEPALPEGRERVWTDKPPGQKKAVYANRRRTNGARGKRLQRERSERVERTFAHVCETGGARRTWLRGHENVAKRYLIAAVAHNLGRLMRELFGMGTPRGLQQAAEALCHLFYAPQFLQTAVWRLLRVLEAHTSHIRPSPTTTTRRARCGRLPAVNRCSSTGC
jgi:transposase